MTIALVVAGPSWASDVALSPAIKLTFTGASAPKGVAHIPARKTATLTVVGPAKLTLRFFGLRDKRGKKILGPGTVAVRLDRNKSKLHALSKKRMTRWKVARHARWMPTAERKVTLSIANGKHTIKISPSSAAPVGVAFIATFTGRTPPPSKSPGFDEPPLPGGMFGSAADGSDSLELDLLDLAFGVDEPELPMGPGGGGSDQRVTQRLTIVGSPPPTHILISPIGSERFLNVSIAGTLHLGVHGPGVLLFEIHAHRDAARADTLKPVVIGLLVDEILVQTVSLDQPASPEYRIDGASFIPSLRVTVRVPIDDGKHRVRLTLSDTAVLGASVRPRFENLTHVDEPGLLTIEAARRADLRAASGIREVSGMAGLGFSGAIWLPSSMKHAGMVGLLEGTFGIPVAGPRLALGLYGGFGRTEDPRLYADDRAPLGSARTNLIVTMVPIVLDAHWSAPIPQPVGVEAGIGGGVMLLWTELRAAGVRSKESVHVGAIGWVQVTALLEAGPGAFFLRGAFIAGMPMTTKRWRNFDPGGAMASFGYRLILVGGD